MLADAAFGRKRPMASIEPLPLKVANVAKAAKISGSGSLAKLLAC